MKFVFYNSYQNTKNGIEICNAVNGKYFNAPTLWMGNQLEILNAVKNCDVVIIWNSLEPSTFWMKNICRKYNKPFLFMENGFVPQKKFFSFGYMWHYKRIFFE